MKGCTYKRASTCVTYIQYFRLKSLYYKYVHHTHTEECEEFDVTHLINKQYSRNQLCYTLIYIFVNNL